MEGHAALNAVEAFAALVGIAALVALGVRRVRVPYSVALVLVGLVVAAIGPPLRLSITPDLVLVVLLPGLIFEAAYQLDFEELRRTFAGVAVLAVPGVVISAGIVAVVLTTTTDLPATSALLVGAMVSATDPVAVISTFKRLRSPRRLATLVEAESLLNDGTAIVIFGIALQAAGGTVTPGGALIAFVAVVAASALIGLAVGLVASRVVARVDDHLIELTISLLVAYGTYLVADRLGQSGIIATVVAGVTLGTYGRRIGMSQRTVEALDTVWEFVAFLLTALVFLLVGLVITVGQLVGALQPIFWGVIAVLAGRALVVYGLVGPLGRALARSEHESWRRSWLHVLFWSGLRGAVAVALALSLPVSLPQRDLLQGITFGIVLFTLLVQGTTAEWVIARTAARDPQPDLALAGEP